MADTNEQPLTVNKTTNDDLTMVTFPTSLKLHSTNYLGWKTQIEALLHGLDLHKFIDGTHPSPAPDTAKDGSVTPHKDYSKWFRQDRLLFGALVGTLYPEIITVVQNAKTSFEAWKILAATYASPSRGHIKQLQYRLKQSSKTPTQSVSDYLQTVKTIVDELSILGKNIDQEDVTDIILNGLDQETYKPTIDAVHARDSPITFNELHEKLINQELALAQMNVNKPGIHQPATVFVAHSRANNRPWNGRQHNPSTYKQPNPPLLPTPPATAHLGAPSNQYPNSGNKPFLGRCQWCQNKGHTVANCTSFKKMFPNAIVPSLNRHMQGKSNPQVNMMGIQGNSSTWLFDSGASHHVTNDLNALSLHAPYDGTEELVIGDGSNFQTPSS